MWVLETGGDALHGKKLWLRPGKKFIFGRTKSEDGQFVISNKTISRQHLTVEVGATGSAECRNAQARSILTLTDCDTKIGTLVNGEQIRGKSHVVQSDRNAVKLGRYEYHFTFMWVPVNLTFSFTSKEARADPYTALYEQLGPLDIKVLSEYKRGVTTHLVAKKRNTSKGLQALVDGKYIVHNDGYIKALVAAATPPEDGSKPQSPLEEDWDESFPDPLQYLPPRGEEPTQREATAYSPNPVRQDMFEGYTFVFYEKKQFENLLAPIAGGLGKAILREVVPEQTTVDEFVRFVKDVAGEKGLGKFEDGSEGKGVVVVRFNPVKGIGSEWFADFNREVSLYLDHRLIEQNEFLDAILGNDASVLRRPLEFVQSGVAAAAPPPTAPTPMSSQAFQSSPPPQAPVPTPTEMAPPADPTRRGRSRRTAAPRFKPFDDDFNGPSGLIPIPESMVTDSTPAVESQSQGLFVSQDPEPRLYVDREASQLTEVQRSSRKRSTPPVHHDDDDDEEDLLADIAPRVAAFKKRKIADDAARMQRGESTPPASVVKENPVAKAKIKVVKKELDVAEFLHQQQEKTEALARAEREEMQESMNAEDIEAIGKLTTVVEEMQLRRSEPPRRPTAQADESDRWDERWNGRKNFKKFRRRGADAPGPNFNRIIVPLEEVKKKDFGIGDEYWLEGERDSQRRKKKGKGKETQDISESQSQARSKNRRAAEVLMSDAEEDLLDDVPPSSSVEIVEKTPEPRPKVARGKKLGDKTNESQNLPAASKKRAAATALTKPAPVKRARETPVDDSDDSDDGLKFKFTRRR